MATPENLWVSTRIVVQRKDWLRLKAFAAARDSTLIMAVRQMLHAHLVREADPVWIQLGLRAAAENVPRDQMARAILKAHLECEPSLRALDASA